MQENTKKHYERNEEEIDLKDLFWRIVLRWREIIIWAIAMGVIIGGLGYVQSIRKYNAALETKEHKQSLAGQDRSQLEISEELTAAQLREVQNIVEQYRQLEQQREFQAKDVFMQLDGYNVRTLYMQFYVQVSDEALSATKDGASDINYQRQTLAEDLISAYIRLFDGDEVLEELKEGAELKCDIQQIPRLLNISKEDEGNTIAVTMTLLDNMNIDYVMEMIENIMLEKSAELEAEIPHTITIVNQSFRTRYEQSVIDAQNQSIKNIYTMEADITKLRNALNSDQEAYLFALLAIDSNQAVADRAIDETGFEPKDPSVSLKYIAIGILLGIMIQCGWVVLHVVMASRLLAADQIADNYGVEVFGNITVSKMKKRFLQKIDDFLLRKKDRHKKKRSMEEQIKSCVSGISLACEQHGVKKVVLTGTCMEQYDQEVLRKIRDGIAKREIEVKFLNDIYYNADDLVECAKVGNVVLIEEVNRSIYEEMENELDKTAEFNIRVLGAVVLE